MRTPALSLVLCVLALAAVGCQPKPTHYVQVQVRLEAAGVDPAAMPALRAQAVQILDKRFRDAGMEGVLLLEDPAAADGLRACFPGKSLPDGMPGSLLNQTKLELCLVHPHATKPDTSEAILDQFNGALPEGYRLVPYLGGSEEALSGPAQLLVATDAVITDADIKDARPGDSEGQPSVSFTLVETGAERFGRVTAANIGRQLAILLDGQALSAPIIQSKITDSGIITGLGKPSEAEDIALCLRSHALPCKVAILSQKVITRESLAQ